jgi:hypothetical protein
MKYKVSFSGFAYVEADSEDEAIELYQNDTIVYSEQDVDLVETVDEFSIEW